MWQNLLLIEIISYMWRRIRFWNVFNIVCCKHFRLISFLILSGIKGKLVGMEISKSNNRKNQIEFQISLDFERFSNNQIDTMSTIGKIVSGILWIFFRKFSSCSCVQNKQQQQQHLTAKCYVKKEKKSFLKFVSKKKLLRRRWGTLKFPGCLIW